MKSIKDMTLEEKIGQCLVIGFPGPEITPEALDLIRAHHIGNIILFAHNITSIDQLTRLNEDLDREIRQATGITPFIMIDQEGGMVTRIMDGGTFFPGAMSVSATTVQAAGEVGTRMGRELLALGVNCDLAPSLDVNNNSHNPVIGVRSYSDDPERVARFGLAMISGLEGEGVLATAKHFPGHGDTSVDSHLGLPRVDKSREELERMELKSFRAAISAHVGAIMSAHIIFSALDPEKPATLSRPILHDLLREELGFQGLVMSDCMEMKAIDNGWTTEQGVVMGLAAGLDIAMISHTASRQYASLAAIDEALARGILTPEALDEKVTRILKAKAAQEDAYEKGFRQKSWEARKAIVTDPADAAFASAVVDRSLTRVRGEDFYPLPGTLVIASEPFATTIAEDTLSKRSIRDALKGSGLPFTVVPLSLHPTDEETASLLAQARSASQVVVATYNARIATSQGTLVRKLAAVTKNLYVISTRNPYDLLEFPMVKNYVCLYEYTPNSCQTIRKYLAHDLVPTGRLPLSLAPSPVLGASVYVGLEPYTITRTLAYLDLLKQKGIKELFVSAHMPEMSSGFEGDLARVLARARENGITVSIDVSRPMMDHFTIPEGIILRLDWGFSNEEIVALSKTNRLELNASGISPSTLSALLVMGLETKNVTLSHNFYPKKGTGLSREDTLSRDEAFHALGFTVQGFIPTTVMKRPPCSDGLPTVEEMREHDITTNVLDARLLGFDRITFGDAYATEEELTLALSALSAPISLPITIYDDLTALEREQLAKVQTYRIDAAASFIRCGLRSREAIAPKGTTARPKNAITIDNEGFGRYQGEICCQKIAMNADERVNVVGYTTAPDFLIEAIKPGTRFVYRIEKEVKR